MNGITTESFKADPTSYDVFTAAIAETIGVNRTSINITNVVDVVETGEQRQHYAAKSIVVSGIIISYSVRVVATNATAVGTFHNISGNLNEVVQSGSFQSTFQNLSIAYNSTLLAPAVIVQLPTFIPDYIAYVAPPTSAPSSSPTMAPTVSPASIVPEIISLQA